MIEVLECRARRGWPDDDLLVQVEPVEEKVGPTTTRVGLGELDVRDILGRWY
jgi:hypothetical protein